MDAHHNFLVLRDSGDDIFVGNLSRSGFLSPGIETIWEKDKGLFMFLAFKWDVISIIERRGLFVAVIIAQFLLVDREATPIIGVDDLEAVFKR